MGAVISDCGLYRFELDRDVAPAGPVYVFVGVNPSTAGPVIPDPTVTRLVGFVQRWGGSKFYIANAFAWRSQYVSDLASVTDHKHEENRKHIMHLASKADYLVPMWGSRNKLPRPLRAQLDITMQWLRSTGKPIRCFGRVATGDPTHPLMLAYDTPLRPWLPPLPKI